MTEKNDTRMIVDLQATLDKVRKQTKRLVDETDEQYNQRTLHMAYMVVEHGTPIMKKEDEVNDDSK
jgi:hypothetical protein